jgi:hypothetical protein
MTKQRLLDIINTIPDNSLLGVSFNMEDIYDIKDVTLTSIEDSTGETRTCIDFTIE